MSLPLTHSRSHLPEVPREWLLRFGADRTEVLFCALAILVGLGNAFTVRLVGLMPLSELVLLGVAGFSGACLLLGRRLAAPLVGNRLFALLVISQVVAFAGYLLADSYRGSAPDDAIRGWARMVFLAIDIFAIGILFGKSPRVFPCYLAGVALSAGSILVKAPLFGDYWKFGVGFPLTVFVLLVAPWLGSAGALAGMLAIGLAHHVMDYRSMAAACWLVAALVAVNQFPPRWRRGIAIAGAMGLLAALPYAAGRLQSSDSSRHGRSNAERSAMIQAATEAIAASPLLGHGSWFSRTNVMDEFVEIRTENARLAGVGGFDEKNGEDMAIHSQILVSMAEGGILGGAFFLAYGAGLLRALAICTVVRPWDVLSLRYMLILVCSTMALCVSPFSGAARVEIAAATGVILLLWQERRTRVTRRDAHFSSSPQPSSPLRSLHFATRG